MYHDPESHFPESALAAASLPALRVGLIGLGTVGAGTLQVLQRNRHEIALRAGRPIRVTVATARNLQRAASVLGPAVRLVGDAQTLINDPEVDVVVEAVGGTELPRQWLLQALALGKPVVTANKALLAHHGSEIFAAASAAGTSVAFEGAVAVSIPIIKALREGLGANRIEWLAGIINGTSNFILSAMRERGLGFEAALAEAQRLGYAEADPAFDVDGVDAAHKLTLLSAMAFGTPVQFDRVHVEGIRHLQAQDVRLAERLGYRVKLLGITRRRPEGLELRVHPALLPADQLLAQVNGSMNGILVKGDASGVTMYYGAGAGSEPTASAVIADLIDLVRLHGGRHEHRVPHLAFQPAALRPLPVLPMAALRGAHYLRWSAADEAGLSPLMARLVAALEAHRIPVRRLERVPGEAGQAPAVVVLTGPALEGDVVALRAAMAMAQGSGGAGAQASAWLRIESLG
jgi:homoserine dehydrogenase